ncbi:MULTISPECIES: neutral zinc metallopeptidase [Micromonospora]|uniref:Neutral zinc metallopeptidase n=1 Tax=Micromonospora yangpuensis TaxID=683228 RepID=A0A1C6USG4_9ACTN|nr:neutral zinc metallopeptidase [Micromonospora yangpuensis]SCL56916.1 hypothetical protein GA0070617_3382 [Micromonospora yangpuensis]
MTASVRPRRRGSLVGLVAALIAAGCVVGEVPGDDGAAPPRAPQQSQEQQPPRSQAQQDRSPGAQTTRADGTDTPEEFQQDIADAQRLAERYWSRQFQASGQRFQPVRRVLTYQRDGEVTCGGQAVPANNAVYCSVGDFIAYDINWSFSAFRQVGDAFVFYLLGHEYAHGVQIRLGIRYEFTIQQELQADCMAGAYLGDSVRDRVLTLDDGDLEEFRDGLLAVGDSPDQPWFAEGAHGTPEQRVDAFFRGYQRSLAACDL